MLFKVTASLQMCREVATNHIRTIMIPSMRVCIWYFLFCRNRFWSKIWLIVCNIHIYSITVIYDYSSIFVIALTKLFHVLKMTKVQFIFVLRNGSFSFSIQTERKIKLSPWLLLLSGDFIWFLRMREPVRWPLKHEAQTQNWFCLLSLPSGTQVVKD